MIDAELLHEAEMFSKSAVAAELFRRMEERFTADWKVAGSAETREAAWRMVQATLALRAELTSLVAEPKVTAFNRRLSPNHN